MGVYVIREGLAEADELLPSWGLGTGQVWCMATLTCLCLQEWDGTYEGDPSYRHSPGKTDRTCPMPAPRSFGSFRKFSQRREILLPESGTMKTVLCCMKGGLFAAARPVWLYNSNLQAASLHHSTSHTSGSSSAGFCTILKTFYLLPCCIVRLA